jgi:hypothetical protein
MNITGPPQCQTGRTTQANTPQCTTNPYKKKKKKKKRFGKMNNAKGQVVHITG